MYTRSQAQQTNNTQNNKKTLHISKNLKLQKSKNQKKSRNPKTQKSKKKQKSKNPRIQNFLHLRNLAIIFDFLDFWTFGFWIFGILDFWTFGFLDFRSRCLITVMDKLAKCAFLRVVGGVSIYIYIYIYTHEHAWITLSIYDVFLLILQACIDHVAVCFRGSHSPLFEHASKTYTSSRFWNKDFILGCAVKDFHIMALGSMCTP